MFPAPIQLHFIRRFQSHAATSREDVVLMFLLVLRALRWRARLVLNLTPLPMKPDASELAAPKKEATKKEEEEEEDFKAKKEKESSSESEMVEPPEKQVKVKKDVKSKNKASKKSDKRTNSGREDDAPPKQKEPKGKSSTVSKMKGKNKERKKSDSDSEMEENLPSKSQVKAKGSKLIKAKTKKKVSGSEREVEKELLTPKKHAKVTTKDKRVKAKESVSKQSKHATAPKFSPKKTRSRVRAKATQPQNKKAKIDSSSELEEEGPKALKTSKNAKSKVTQSDSEEEYTPEKAKKRKSTSIKSTKSKVVSKRASSRQKAEPLKLSSEALKEAQDRSAARARRRGPKNSDSEDDFVPEKAKKRRASAGKVQAKASVATNYWIEVAVRKGGAAWLAVDVVAGKVKCAAEMESRASKPLLYVLAANEDGTVKDVTKRYSPDFNGSTLKKRSQTEEFMQETIMPFASKDDKVRNLFTE